MSQQTDVQLLTGATTIKNETIAQANTAIRVGTLFQNIIDSKVNKILFNSYTGTTAPTTYLTKSLFNGYSGTTAPASYLSKSSFNTYSGTTLTNINTRLLSTIFNSYTGTTAPSAYALKSNFNTFTGTTAPATYLTKSAFNTYSGITSTRLTTIESGYITGATNLGTGNGLFTSVSGHKTQFKSLVAGTNITLTPSSTGITISSTGGGGGSGTITGATNGLSITGAKIKLGGILTGNTNINISTFNFNITGTTGTLRLKHNILLLDGANSTGKTLTQIRLTDTQALFNDSRVGIAANGLNYGANYSANYTSRSLVDKGFVTGITSTLLNNSVANRLYLTEHFTN